METSLRMLICLTAFAYVFQFTLTSTLGQSLGDAFIEAAKEEDTHLSSCASTRRIKRHTHGQFPSAPPTGSKFGKALQFMGREAVKFNAKAIPSRQFTLDFWLKPEGGQKSPVVVFGLFDHCSPFSPRNGWKIGLIEADEEKGIRVFFSLQTQRSEKETTIVSPQNVKPGVWLHVAATYDGRKMKLYVNQAEVAASSGQNGHIFASPTAHPCETLEAGGDNEENVFFRGTIDEVRLWSVAKSHEEISKTVFVPQGNSVDPEMQVFEEFSGSEVRDGKSGRSWSNITPRAPEVVESTIPGDPHDLSILKPPCGITVCDNPEVVKSYLSHSRTMKERKVMRYRIVNVMDDDGRNPIVSFKQIKFQHRLINNAFKRYNISWQLLEENIYNTSLRRRTVLYMCEASKIGNGQCDRECNYSITGDDGGDCVKHRPPNNCDRNTRNNGKCDLECNSQILSWDNGDCCNPAITDTHKTCFDPNSPHRAYMSVREYKSIVNLDNRGNLTVYFAQWSDRNLQGVATFPWEKSVHSIYGGIVLDSKTYAKNGHSHAIIHEIGHVLGLWHVHHGVSEIKSCSDECAETFPSLELGDLCSDTSPTPANDKCSDPKPKDKKCGFDRYKDTPFNNYMGYADDSCTSIFTRQQVARMHCYIDLVYQSWQPEQTKPSFIPLPPRVTSAHGDSIEIAWIPPLGTGGQNAVNQCHECHGDSFFQQYAVTASSPIPAKPNGYWAPHQAVGAPDSEPCYPTPQAWTPLTQSDAMCPDCFIELGFKEAVVPTLLAIWVTNHPKDGISDIELFFTDGTNTSIGNATAQCDAPLTLPLRVGKKKVSKIRIHVSDRSTGIDAVQLTSSVDHPNCLKCKSVYYMVNRDPPLPSGRNEMVDTTRYVDRNVEAGKSYTYTVQAMVSSILGPRSPPLVYTPERGFCGDGRVDERTGEECDDSNVRDGDGCNSQCKKEDVYHCKGHPSLCYRHDGDGICENFEKKTSVQDCGFYTPDGFLDQWAVNVTVNPEYKSANCPESVVIGPPSRDLVCQSVAKPNSSWSPCKDTQYGNYWLEVSFDKPVVPAAVVLYIASDGKREYKWKPKTVMVTLIDAEGQSRPSWNQNIPLTCSSNPVIIPVYHDMTKPFFYVRKARISFTSRLIAIAGVALRSQRRYDPVALASCTKDEVFSPRTQRCHKYSCERPFCPKLTKLKHASVNCEGDEEGQTCEVTCKDGYRPSKPFKLMCLSKKWQGPASECVPVNCGFPKIKNAKPDCPEGTTYGKQCSFKCVSQAKLKGSDVKITCEGDGKWSLQQSFCTMTCPVPDPPGNTTAFYSSHCLKNQRIYPGKTCKYLCKPGFRNQETGDKTLRLRCSKSGKTTGPSCEPITCKAMPQRLLYSYNCTNGNFMGSLCTYHCKGEQSHVLRCKENGEWSGQPRRCKSMLADRCEEPQVSPGISAQCDDLLPGGTCRPKCRQQGYDVAVKEHEEDWKVTLTCTNKLTWSPEASQLYCVKSCDKSFMGDGWCDPVNNNKHCRWDKGDCCASTTDQRAVRRFPDDCEQECDCKDPDAVENKPGGDDEDDDSDGSNSEGSGSNSDLMKVPI